MSATLEYLIQRSDELHGAIRDTLSSATIADHPRARLSAAHADIALEHGASQLLLVASGHRSSALALQRVQLDAVVRALWVLYAASDAKIGTLAAAVEDGSLKEPNNMPGISDMIEQVSRRGPDGVGRSLTQFKDPTWGPLSSFIHGGIFALHERFRQLPDAWSMDTLRNSNGLSIMAAMTISVATQNTVPPGAMREIQLKFLDCCPPAAPSS